jgi:hypothetical protein
VSHVDETKSFDPDKRRDENASQFTESSFHHILEPNQLPHLVDEIWIAFRHDVNELGARLIVFMGNVLVEH